MTAPTVLRPPKTVRDLCRVTGLSPASVRAGITNGQLPGSRVGKKFIIPADAFDDYCHGRWVPHPPPVPAPIYPLIVRRDVA